MKPNKFSRKRTGDVPLVETVLIPGPPSNSINCKICIKLNKKCSCCTAIERMCADMNKNKISPKKKRARDIYNDAEKFMDDEERVQWESDFPDAQSILKVRGLL